MAIAEVLNSGFTSSTRTVRATPTHASPVKGNEKKKKIKLQTFVITRSINSFLPVHKDSSLWENPSNLPHTKNLRYSFITFNSCQYETVDIATAKEIAAEVIVCYLGMLCKWKTAVLAWFSVFQ